MTDLFKILDGIIASEYCVVILADTGSIVNYAEACGVDIDYAQAELIKTAGDQLIIDLWDAGDGECGSYWADARAALQD